MERDFLTIEDFSKEEILGIFEDTDKIKQDKTGFNTTLENKYVGLLFEKPSLRTRVSFEVGVLQLGGKVLYLSPQEVKLGVRETVSDAAKTISNYLDAVVIRTFKHQTLLEFSESSKIPVINGLTDLLHPAQVLSDLYTIYNKKGSFADLKVSFIGDGNNVCHSLLLGGAKLGMNLSLANPPGFEPEASVLKKSENIAKDTGARIEVTGDPKKVAKGSDVLYTDVWVSMGEGENKKNQIDSFKNFQINFELLKSAKDDCIVMHCLPAHRGEEITDEVLDGDNSVVFEQAGNRLYVQKALMMKMLQN